MSSKIKLFCIPYSGATENVYLTWSNQLHKEIKIIPLELSGRGRRSDEPLYKNMQEAVEDLYQQLIRKGADEKFVLFGHSLGGTLAYEICCKLLSEHNKNLVRLIVSGVDAPHYKRNENIHLMSDVNLKNKLKEYGGTPDELLNDEVFVEYFLPIIRSDFRIAEQYIPQIKNILDIDVSVFYGKDDTMHIGELSEWSMYTNKTCKVHAFNGDHFFIHKCEVEVLKVIKELLI